ncbi:MAG: molybdopterin molybdotransferase MoeA, partial [Inquilinus sp.]|nr:molybdopterin molybdotransferase MoeA [Inquilinus sp.]
MAQLSDDCFAFGGKLMPVDEAVAEFDRRLDAVTDIETVPLDVAVDRFLAEDIVAGRAVPPHDNSAVDGYAVFFDDLDTDAETRLPVIGRVTAGHPLDDTVRRGTAVRVFTGAPMPAGPDTVLMQEDCRLEGERVVLPPGIKRGANHRFAGEDIAAGTVVLHAGRRLRPRDIGLVASLGLDRLPVRRRLRVALFSTGDEVREPGTPAPEGCIYDANRHALAAQLARLGCEVGDLGIAPDRPEAVGAALDRAIEGYDLIVSSGGMSTGEEDHVKAALEAAGGTLHAWRLAIKPGRPVALGQIGPVPFIGLPGNPVAVLVTFLRVARPLILRLAGGREPPPHLFPVRAAFAYRKKRDRREYVRVTLAD